MEITLAITKTKIPSNEAITNELKINWLINPTIIATTPATIYNGLISKNVFHTPVGIGFLYELRLRLLASPEINAEEIQPIPVPRSRTNRKMQPPIPMKDYRKPFYISTALAIVFGISIIGMFIIMKISDNNVTILNYRNAIINEYAEWEKELQEREAKLDNYIPQEP